MRLKRNQEFLSKIFSFFNCDNNRILNLYLFENGYILFEMSGLYCPNCGKLHESAEKFCMFCGDNLESLILEYKNQRLPVKIENTAPQRRIMSKDEYDRYYLKGKPLPKVGTDSPIEADRKKRWILFEFISDILCLSC